MHRPTPHACGVSVLLRMARDVRLLSASMNAKKTIPVLEWLFWLVLSFWLYQQTSLFDKPITEYAFGATGWPRVLCFLLLTGATGQLINHLFFQRAVVRDTAAVKQDEDDDNPSEDTPPPPPMSIGAKVTAVCFFILPLLYLYLLPTFGFYLLTPFFILAALQLLGVRSIKAIVGVVLVVYGLMLLIFTRFFYVALPVGSEGVAYDINNMIIVLARMDGKLTTWKTF